MAANARPLGAFHCQQIKIELLKFAFASLSFLLALVASFSSHIRSPHMSAGFHHATIAHYD